MSLSKEEVEELMAIQRDAAVFMQESRLEDAREASDPSTEGFDPLEVLRNGRLADKERVRRIIPPPGYELTPTPGTDPHIAAGQRVH